MNRNLQKVMDQAIFWSVFCFINIHISSRGSNPPNKIKKPTKTQFH